jgi:tetratricopeptide (TPR) repeat protein
MGNLQAALVDLNQAIKVKPNYADAYYNRGKARTALRDAKGAIADFTQAVRFNSNLAEAYGNRGLLYSEIGNKQAALADLQKAAEIFKQQGDQGSYDQTEFYIRQLQKLDK